MTDKATPTLRQRCDTALQSLPDAPYKTMLAVLFDDMTAEVERLAAQAAPTEPPQEFESAQGRALASAWAEGWAQCRDAEYVGEEAESEAFNQSATLAQCLHADQTRFQGGLSNDELRRAWSAKLPNVMPTDEQLTAFALGIEAAAQPSQAPVVLATSDTARRLAAEFRGTVARKDFEAWGEEVLPLLDGMAAAPVVQAVPDSVKFICVDCTGCEKCRASSGATTQAVRMLTEDEQAAIIDMHSTGRAQGDHECAEAIQRKFCEVNKLPAPADGVIGGV
jgi:hypothetical protein